MFIEKDKLNFNLLMEGSMRLAIHPHKNISESPKPIKNNTSLQ